MQDISLLWELFNEILTNLKGKNYKFNLKSIMVDRVMGQYYCTVRKVLEYWNLQHLK